jgi:cysteine synthase A
VSSDGFAREKLQTMRLFGADLQIVASENGKLTPELFRAIIDKAKRLGEEPNTYYTDQFNNTDAIQGYMGIGKELFEQVGVGTAGMLMGVSRALKPADRRPESWRSNQPRLRSLQRVKAGRTALKG